jgi:hypothetical protein
VRIGLIIRKSFLYAYLYGVDFECHVDSFYGHHSPFF